MAIKYEIQEIKTVLGQKKSNRVVRLQQGDAMTADALGLKIEASSTVTRADLKAVMDEVARVAIDELSQGRRVYLPEIGYLWLSVGCATAEQKDDEKLTGKDIFVRNINFRPEKQFLEQVRKKVNFEKSDHTSRSKRYDEDALWAQMETYLAANHYLTIRRMKDEFKLSDYMARQWLSRFVSAGRLTVEGSRHQRMFFPAPPSKG